MRRGRVLPLLCIKSKRLLLLVLLVVLVVVVARGMEEEVQRPGITTSVSKRGGTHFNAKKMEDRNVYLG